MNADNTRRLIEAFPDLYRDHTKPMTESLMCFGFECDDGWFQIIWDLSQKLVEIAERHGVEIRAFQVKEKFGELRFYIDKMPSVARDEIRSVTDEATRRSLETCEASGRPGTMHHKGYWMRTLAPDVAEELGYELGYPPPRS